MYDIIVHISDAIAAAERAVQQINAQKGIHPARDKALVLALAILERNLQSLEKVRQGMCLMALAEDVRERGEA